MSTPTAAVAYETVAEVADRLKIKPVTVHRLAAEGELPCHRVGGRRIVFDPAEVDAWVHRHDASGSPIAASQAPETSDDPWLAEQLGKFTPDDLRRAARLFAALAADADRRAVSEPARATA